MKHFITLFITFSAYMCAVSFCNAQMTGITIEVDTAFYGPNTPTPEDTFDPMGTMDGMVTYQVYANFTNSTDVLSAIYSDVVSLGTIPMAIDAPCGCHNPIDVGLAMDGSNSSLFWETFPMWQYDTYWTIGMESGDAPGVLPQSIGLPPGSEVCSASVSDGSIFTLGGPINAIAGNDLRILIAQVTTCGDWCIGASFQVFIEGNQAQVQFFEPTEPTCIEFGNQGCIDPVACNYDSTAVYDDGSCDYCSCVIGDYTLTVEEYQVHSTTEGLAELVGLTTYRFYITNLAATDLVSAVYGNNENPFELSVPGGIYNTSLNASWSASGISPVFVDVFPEIEFDSYATIGLTTSASTSGMAEAADPSIVEDPTQQLTPIFLIDGSTGVTVNSITGMAYYILNGNPVGLPDGTGRVLIMQITTPGTISGTINVQIFPNGEGANFVTTTYMFDGAGTFGGDETGVACGCTDVTACNFDPTATFDDGTNCIFAVEYLDCEGNCLLDSDMDGICDELEISGCLDMTACNYNQEATDDDGLCDYSCCPGPGCCYNGTTWDINLQACIVLYPSDSNFDGCVDLNDLMDLLSAYGICLEPE